MSWSPLSGGEKRALGIWGGGGGTGGGALDPAAPGRTGVVPRSPHN